MSSAFLEMLWLQRLAMVSRRRACALAVENAQRKAAEVSQLLGQALGPPLLVREEETREWRSDQEEDAGGNHPVARLPHLPSMPTVTAFSRVSVSFGLRDDSRKNLWLHLPLADEVLFEVNCLTVFCMMFFFFKLVCVAYWCRGPHQTLINTSEWAAVLHRSRESSCAASLKTPRTDIVYFKSNF